MACTRMLTAIGGTPACLQIAEALYRRIDTDPLLRPLFPGKTHRCAIEAFSAFLVQLLGGPSGELQHRWWLSVQESHLRFPIGRAERDAWLKHMLQALDDVPLDDASRAALRDFFERTSMYVINQGAQRPDGGAPRDPELAERWAGQRALDDAITALRGGDNERVLELAKILDLDPGIRVGLLAQMIEAGKSALLEYVHEEIRGSPALVRARFNNRTLLHYAAAAGSLTTVEVLLQCGADADAGLHTPLYSLANGCTIPGGGKIVHALIAAGARVDACEGVKRCTPLHMAARRGAVEIAGALLDCGADIEARDSVGETPLRRAVNCNKPEVAALLVARGANVRSRGSKGLTALDAARSDAMRRVLAGRTSA